MKFEAGKLKNMSGFLVASALIFFAAIAILIGLKEEPSREDEPRSSGVDTPNNTKVHSKRTAEEPATEKPSLVSLCGPAYVTDGDSVVICKTQIRLFGVDAPELDHPYGKVAKRALLSLCKGQKVRAEIREKDVHGRTVAQCFLEDGRDLSAEMVKLGLAIDWPKFSGGKYRPLEIPSVRKKLWLANARQKGHMHVWRKFESRQKARSLEN